MIMYDWNEELGLSQCVITDSKNNIAFNGYGSARCHEDDKDMQSQMTGEYIATCRAQIDALRQKRDYDLKSGLMALKHLKATMIHSKKYNPDSYEAKRLNKEIKNLEKEINYINDTIYDLQNGLKIYLENKEALYQSLRKKGQI